MRFDPKPTPDRGLPAVDALDQPDVLPEDLALLGCALSDDAARLAERYPADHGLGATSEALESATPGSRKSASAALQGWRAAAAIALVAASAMLAVYLGQYVMGQPESPLADQGPARGLVHSASGTPGALQLVPSARTDDLLPLRGAFFRELSGPQQEAVLDLLEDDALAQGKVSI